MHSKCLVFSVRRGLSYSLASTCFRWSKSIRERILYGQLQLLLQPRQPCEWHQLRRSTTNDFCNEALQKSRCSPTRPETVPSTPWTRPETMWIEEGHPKFKGLTKQPSASMQCSSLFRNESLRIRTIGINGLMSSAQIGIESGRGWKTRPVCFCLLATCRASRERA